MRKPFFYWLYGLVGVLGAFVFFLSSQTIAQTPPLKINIVTGNEVGEYYAIGKDLEELGRQNNLNINAIPTRGALENTHDVFQYESIPLGITQSDLLAFLTIFGNNDELIRQRAEALRIVSPLYQEEVHLIANREISSIEELEGKKVSIGQSGSGTSMTAATILYDLGISPDQLLTFEAKRGIDAVRDGEIDALFYVIGAPARVLNEEISSGDNLHLLPVKLPIRPEDEFFNALYNSVTVPANTYPWQPEPVETITVESLLFTISEQDCKVVTPVARIIKDNLSWLQENGEGVWQRVTLQGSPLIRGQRRSRCAVL